jgi:oleate hydratase
VSHLSNSGDGFLPAEDFDTQEGIYRTRYNQYESMAVPLVNWPPERAVEIRLGTTVRNLRFAAAGTQITAESIEYVEAGVENAIPLGTDDCVFVTIGSMTANKTFRLDDERAHARPQ